MAVAHSILIAVYHILKDGVGYKKMGADYYNQLHKERKINGYLKKLKNLGGSRKKQRRQPQSEFQKDKKHAIGEIMRRIYFHGNGTWFSRIFYSGFLFETFDFLIKNEYTEI